MTRGSGKTTLTIRGQIGGHRLSWGLLRELAGGRFVFEGEVPARGFEPRTLGLKGRCSARLSYTGDGQS